MNMSTETDDFTDLIRKITDLCANGSAHAKYYLEQVNYAVETIDDLIDKDIQVKDERIFRTFFILFCELYSNPFFLSNLSLLVGVHIAAYNAWMDANIWEKSGDELKKMYAHVIRDYICELCQVVAFITGGYQNMRKVSLVIRDALKEDYELEKT